MQFDLHLFLQTTTATSRDKSRDLFQLITVAALYIHITLAKT